MTLSLTFDPETYARRIAGLRHAAGPVQVAERLAPADPGQLAAWSLHATVPATAWHALALHARVGVRGPDDGDHWPAHVAALHAVRDAVGLIEAAAADAGLDVVALLDVTAAVIDQRPHRLAHWAPTPSGRRLAGALAWCAARTPKASVPA